MPILLPPLVFVGEADDDVCHVGDLAAFVAYQADDFFCADLARDFCGVYKVGRVARGGDHDQVIAFAHEVAERL